MARVVYTVQNPTDPEQFYALWDTGRIDRLAVNPSSLPLPILDGPQWFDRPVPPGRAMYVSDWAGPSGYVMDREGLFYPFGAATAPGGDPTPNAMPGVTYVPGSYRYVDVAFEPNNTGQGYALDVYGRMYHFGGATACPRSGSLWTSPIGRRLEMQWAPFKRSIIMDAYGGRNQDFPAQSLGQTDGYFDETRDWARDVRITDWGNSGGTVRPSGWMLLASGVVVNWGPTPPAEVFGFFVGQAGTQRGLHVVSGADPLTLAQISTGGNLSVYSPSSPPVVTAGGEFGTPADPTTDTTRPTLTWSYADPEGDRQVLWQLAVFTQAFASANVMTYPLKHRASAVVDETGTDPTQRGIVCPVDLANGLWRMYVRTQDSSGRWSAWANRGWEQNVPVPAAPSALLATVDEYHTNLSLTTDSPDVEGLALFEFSDDGGLSWLAVQGAEAVPLLAVTDAVDWDIRLGVPRTYRARIFFTLPRVISNPSPLATVTCEKYTFVLTSTEGPELGGEVFAYGSMGWTREVVAGVFEPLGAAYPIVVGDGVTRSRRRTLTLRSSSAAEWDRIVALAESGHILLLREPFGEFAYCRLVGSWSREQLRALPSGDQPQRLAHIHETDLPLVEVARPGPLPAAV